MRESDSRPHILSVCETAQGGVGRYQETLRSLQQYGYDLSVLLPREHAEILPDQTGVIGYRREARSVPALLRLVAGLLSARKRIRPDIYIFNSTFALLPLLALRVLRDRSPSIYCAHCWAVTNYPRASLKGRVVRAVEGRLCGLADLVINVSKGDAEIARRLGYRGYHVVVENAVADVSGDVGQTAPPGFARESEDEIHLLFVGRFDRQKGLDILLPAFEQARSTAPRLRLHLIGGPVRGTAHTQLTEGVVAHGWLSSDQLDVYYAAADALVVPSRWEGLPLIVPEALRNGTPVLVSNRSGMGDLIEEGRDGAVFELSVAALAGLLSRLDRATLQAMRTPARASFERRFTLERFGREMAVQLAALGDARP